MITEDERFIKIQGILAFSDIHPNDCIKINDLIIDLSKQKDYLQNQVEKITQENNDLEERVIHQDNKIKHLQSVIDKAIEYIENNKMYGYKYDKEEMFEIITDDKCKKDLLEILRSNNV